MNPRTGTQRAVRRGELPDKATSYAYDEVVGFVLLMRALVGYPLDDAHLRHLIDAIVLPALRAVARPGAWAGAVRGPSTV